MKTISQILTVAAVGTVLVTAAGAPAGAQPGRVDGTRPSYQSTPGGGDRSPFANAHVDRHVDYRVGGTPRPEREEDRFGHERRRSSDRRPGDELRDGREDSRWAPGAERYTRPPRQWHR